MLETVGLICSGIMTLWMLTDFARSITQHPVLETFRQETYPFITVIVITWFMLIGDPTNFWDLLRLALWGWIWFDAYNNRDDRWKRRKRKASEKVKVLASGKLAVVSNN